MAPELTDYEWLVSGAAEPWLGAGKDQVPTPATVTRLRHALSPQRAGLVATQWKLREKARRKFANADELYFESLALEQATDQTIADYKASSFTADVHIADLCCGIGGDAMSLSRNARVTAVEMDPVRAIFVRANLERLGGRDYEVHAADALQFPLRHVDCWHIDPDRRSKGRRITQCDAMSPTANQIADCLTMNPHALVKVAPASRIPDAWSDRSEQEWVGHSRQCQQQLWRFGRFVRHAGKRTATVLSRANSNAIHQIVEQPMESLRRVDRIGEFLVEPQAAIVAAGLADQFAGAAGLQGFPSRVAYYSSDRPHDEFGSSCYRVVTALPLDLRSVRRWLRDHGARVNTVKTRGVKLDPTTAMKRLVSSGDMTFTLLVFPISDQVMAVLAEPSSRRKGLRPFE